MTTATVSSEPTVAPELRLDHLRALEAESIHVLREVVAEFERPVMLYSIGKDSSVMLRLAQKAFHPGPIPFPLLHVDTTYKFREMIQFRDEMAKTVGARLIVHTNTEAIDDGAQPFKIGTRRCCGLLKTKALLDALEAGRFDAALGGARRDEERSRAKERIFSVRDAKGQWDPKRQRPRAVAPVECPPAAGRNDTRISALQLDRNRRLAVHPRRANSGGSDVFRDRPRGDRPRQLTRRSGTAIRSAPAGRHTAGSPVPHAFARLLTLHRSRAV
jgi:3'-phosphoadenosine 5'-phosphosulfate sulfotransferase (PAPS reductase)/FAD synthetase